MRQGLRSKMREYDPLRVELVAMRHHLFVRDVSRIVAVEIRRLADEEIRALGDGDELFSEAGVAGIGDELPRDLDAQAVRLGEPHVTHRQRAHVRAAELDRLGPEHERA